MLNLLQSSVHMILQKAFLYIFILSMLKTIVLPNIYLKTWCIFFNYLMKIKSIEQHLFEEEIFSNIINIFTVTLDQFNASLLNQNINVYLFWMVFYSFIYVPFPN